MNIETKDAIREKLAQSRRLLHQVSDDATSASLRAYIEELEGRLVQSMGKTAGN
jgi:hypothetical protein